MLLTDEPYKVFPSTAKKNMWIDTPSVIFLLNYKANVKFNSRSNITHIRHT